MMSDFKLLRHMGTEKLYFYVFKLFVDYYTVEVVRGLRRRDKQHSEAETKERVAMAEGLLDFMFHFKETLGEDGTGKRMSRYYTALGTNKHPGITSAGLESHNGILKVRIKNLDAIHSLA